MVALGFINLHLDSLYTSHEMHIPCTSRPMHILLHPIRSHVQLPRRQSGRTFV